MRARLRIDFQGRGKIEAFSGTRIEAMHNGVQLALRIPRQVGALGQVLALQPVRVFIGAALSWAIRIGKEDLDGKSLGQTLVLGHLFAPIIRQGFPQQCGCAPPGCRPPSHCARP